MIAAAEWIPVGRADPAPRRYEPSPAELDLLARVRAADAAAGQGEGEGEDAAEGGGGEAEGEWEDVEDAEGENNEGTGGGNARTKLPRVDPGSLPADLRMDEYSDDDGDDDRGRVVGGLLVGKDAEMDGGPEPDDDVQKGDEKEYNNDDDDDSEDEDDLADIPDTREYMPVDVEGLQALGIGGGGGGKAPGDGEGYTAEDLRNMTMNDAEAFDVEDEDDDEEDAEDVRIRDGDALLVVARAEGDFASLEVNVFDTNDANLYVHHDIPLPSFPLCLALGSVAPSYDTTGDASSGNFAAVGSFDPGIEIWNLDVMNALEPAVVLGGMDTKGAEEDWMRSQVQAPVTSGKKKKKKGGGPPGLREGSHADAVMALSWNAIHRQVLASGSADGTVKLWDVTHKGSGGNGDYARPSTTLSHHGGDKISALRWHPTEGTLLATGGHDRRVCLVDARSAAAGKNDNVKKAKLPADCEAIAWDPHGPQYLTAASEDGVVRCWDVRKFEEPVWDFVAHEYGGVSDICYNAQVPGMLITCSIDKSVALWDTHHGSSDAPPRPCGSKDMNVGRLHSVSIHPSFPWLLACGGGGNEVAVWDMEVEDAVQSRFGDRPISAGEEGAGDRKEPDFEAVMAAEGAKATEKALQNMSKSKKKKGKKKGKAHKTKK
ncbi:hypothetical protein ACHAWF_009510 [Thalassiosira exigua]